MFFNSQINADSGINYSFRNSIHHSGEEHEGFEFYTGLEFPFSFSHSQSRLGISDGNYIQIEGRSVSFLHYLHGIHDWSSSLFIAESFSMAPNIKDRWIKAKDILQFETRYLYNFASWAGAYAHGRLTTSIFKGANIHEREKTYDLRDVNDKTKGTLITTEYALSDPFLPLYLQENFGVFATPINHEAIAWELRTALSFRQTFAKGQKVLADDDKKTAIVRDLQSFFQIGPLAGTSISGKFFKENQLFYHAGLDALWPFWNSLTKERSFLDALIIEGNGAIGYKLNDHFDLTYEYSVRRIPDILEQFQQEHAIHLSLSFDWAYKFAQRPEQK